MIGLKICARKACMYLAVQSGAHRQTPSSPATAGFGRWQPLSMVLNRPTARPGAGGSRAGARGWRAANTELSPGLHAGPTEGVWSPEKRYALRSSDSGNSLEPPKRSKQRVKQGVWTCSPLELSSLRTNHLGLTIPWTLPHLCSSDENMTYRVDFCWDQYRLASLENILLRFMGETVVMLPGNTMSRF